MALKRNRVSIGFLIVWMIFWGAGMLVMAWTFGQAALRGEPQAMLFLGLWIVGAAFGLFSAGRRLRGELLHGTRTGGAPARNHRWNDGITQPKPPSTDRQ